MLGSEKIWIKQSCRPWSDWRRGDSIQITRYSMLTRHLWHKMKFETVIKCMIFNKKKFIAKKSRFVEKKEKVTWWWSTSQTVKVWGRGTANVKITSKPILIWNYLSGTFKESTYKSTSSWTWGCWTQRCLVLYIIHLTDNCYWIVNHKERYFFAQKKSIFSFLWSKTPITVKQLAPW